MEELVAKINYEAKLKELLRNLISGDSDICSEASKKFIKILKSDSGSEFLQTYVLSSPKLVEISEAWEFWKTKPGFLHILKLISGILKHPSGKSNDKLGDNGINTGRLLDQFARMLTKEKMVDLYKELNCKVGKRQNGVLLLLVSIVMRSSHFAWELAKIFDFKLPILRKLAEIKFRRNTFVGGVKKTYLTRKSFISFSMSFLEVGHPRLLKGILQEKDMYSSVLRGLGNDDEETVVYVLSILQDKVLIPQSLVPTGLRSVLFGSATLEQLISISARDSFGEATELAHNVLVLVCTDPVNGLMPDLARRPIPLRGNPKRLLSLMKKLKATEVEYHLGLLLAIVRGSSLFGSAYLDEFPYNLEDLASVNWLTAVSVAANVISSVREGVTFDFVGLQEQSLLENPYLQNIVKCILPRPFSRLIINKGLLHSDPLVKHGTLRAVMEALNLFDSLLSSLNCYKSSSNPLTLKWELLKTDIVNEVRLLLPDPQVLLSLLNPLCSHNKVLKHPTKRKAEIEIIPEQSMNASKRVKSSTTNEDIDILVAGINSFSEIDLPCDGGSGDGNLSKHEAYITEHIHKLWGLRRCSMTDVDLNNGDTYFFSKLLDTLTLYHRTMAVTLEGLFDFFKILPSDPLSMPSILQMSLLQLLKEHTCLFSKEKSPVIFRPRMYKHLRSFISLFLYSSIKEIRELAYLLAKAAIMSTGAFDHNSYDISAWFFFIPGYCSNHIYADDVKVEIYRELSEFVISFLCDVVSATGNNLYKYMEFLRCYLRDSEDRKDESSEVSPFIICVLEKCVRLLISDSRAFTLPQKSLVSIYVSNTIKYLLDTQVNSRSLSFLVDCILSEKLEFFSGKVDVLELTDCPCELRPLKTLLLFSRNKLHQPYYRINSNIEEVMQSHNSFVNTLAEVERVLRDEYDCGVGLTVGFSFALTCTRHIDLLQNFPSILTISSYLHEIPFLVVASIFFLESSYLKDVMQLWPQMFSSGLEKAINGTEQKKEISGVGDLNSTEAASIAFSLYLRQAPFCVLFSAIVQSDSLHFFQQSVLQKFLLTKLTEMPPDHLVSSFCNILCWISHARLSYRVDFPDEVQILSETCCTLAVNLLQQLLVQNQEVVTADHFEGHLHLHYAVEVAEIICNHPTVTSLLDFALPSDKELSGSILVEKLEIVLQMAKLAINQMDHHVLNLLRTSIDILFSICRSQRSEQVDNASQRISTAFELLINKYLLAFKSQFNGCIQSMDFKSLVPSFYALHSLMTLISPSDLLELVNWMFSKVDLKSTNASPFSNIALCVPLHLAGCAFDFLSGSMMQPGLESKVHRVLGAREETHLNVSLFEEIFVQVLEIARLSNLDAADKCLLKAVMAVKKQSMVQHLCISSIMYLSRVVASTPVDILSHCLQKINKTKAELLFHVVQLSPLYLSVFGHMFSEAISNCKPPLPDEELVMILHTVSLYLNSVNSKFGGQLCQSFQSIVLLYQRILLSGFSDWPFFVNGNIFNLEFGDYMPSSIEEFSSILSDSLLGKAILVVRDHLVSSEALENIVQRLNLFNSVCPLDKDAQDDLFDRYCGDIGFHSLEQSLDFVNRFFAKVTLCRMVLILGCKKFQPREDSGEEEVFPLEVTAAVENSRVRFLRMLINSWILIVKKFPKNVENEDGQNISSVSFLEVFIMSNIVDLIANWHGCLTRKNSITFMEELVKSFMIYRFEDHMTQKMCLIVLTHLSKGNFPLGSLMQLFLAHSKFTELFRLSFKSLGSFQLGVDFSPMRSILKSFVVSSTELVPIDCKNDTLSSPQHSNALDLVRMIKVMFRIYAQQRKTTCGEGIDIQMRELVCLLLSSYGATCADVDLEIYNLILEIESNDMSSSGAVARMDYLWGISSLKDKDTHLLDLNNMEDFDDRRKIQFRENLPVDPHICARTVLYFPYDRFVIGGTLHKRDLDKFELLPKEYISTGENLQVYDPVFILRFSNHCLSMSYIEPTEFASLGLLAITFVSLSSPDDQLRKLGYEVLTEFKVALEKCQKKREISRLRLLLSYLQNGIVEPWQRIPSMISVFIAEASVVLLDPSHDHYSTIIKYLMNSPTVNMMAIPLFENFIWSSSSNFRTDRSWILRLLYAGVNVEDDAHPYIKNSIFEKILSFYSSPFSDNDSKEMIIQIVKKAVKLKKLIWVLVERCGLILWLSSILSCLCCCERDENFFFTVTQLPVLLEVLDHIILSRNIVEWLQKHAMEQLSELSSHLFKFLVSGGDSIVKQHKVCDSILRILTCVLKISQKRKIYQPHFTLSENGLFQLYEAAEICFKTNCNPSIFLGLEAVLMSTPPVHILQMDLEKLLKFLRWSVEVAVQSNSANVFQPAYFDLCHIIPVSGKKQDDESLASKLLRWLIASVILGKMSCKLRSDTASLSERSALQTLQSLLDFQGERSKENETQGREQLLAATMLYLLQLLGFSHNFLPSAVSALFLLLSHSAELEFLISSGISLPSLCSEIKCPVEANPSWRWSFYQPWKDRSVELTVTEKLDQIHACEKLLFIASATLRRKSSSHQFPLKDLDKFHVYEWERGLFQ